MSEDIEQAWERAVAADLADDIKPADKVVHRFCAHCGREKEPNRNYADDCGWISSTFVFCANCGKRKEPSRNYVHDECLCRDQRASQADDVLRAHCIHSVHALKPTSTLSGDDLIAWHDKDHTVSAVQIDHSHNVLRVEMDRQDRMPPRSPLSEALSGEADLTVIAVPTAALEAVRTAWETWDDGVLIKQSLALLRDLFAGQDGRLARIDEVLPR